MTEQERIDQILKYSDGVERIAKEVEALIDKRALELAEGNSGTAFLIAGRVQLRIFRSFFWLTLSKGFAQQEENEAREGT